MVEVLSTRVENGSMRSTETFVRKEKDGEHKSIQDILVSTFVTVTLYPW
jgi:hypothetical protein